MRRYNISSGSRKAKTYRGESSIRFLFDILAAMPYHACTAALCLPDYDAAAHDETPDKMRSARTSCDARAIMKKFIYACNVKHYISASVVKIKYKH